MTSTERKPLSWAIITLILINMGLAALVVGAYLGFGPIGRALSHVAGDRLVVDGHVKSFGKPAPGRNRLLVFEAKNTASVPIAIFGARSTCSCAVVAEDLPMIIPPGSRRPIHVGIRGGSRSGAITEALRLYTDYSAQPHVALTVIGTLSGRDSPGEASGQEEARR